MTASRSPDTPPTYPPPADSPPVDSPPVVLPRLDNPPAGIHLTAIHVAPASRLPTRAVEQVLAEAGRGLVGDRYHGTRHRHVTVQSLPDLQAAAAELGGPVPIGATRRNLTLDQGVVPTRPGDRIRIGDVELEVVRLSAPCRLLDDWIGPGAMRAMHRRGGAVCRLLTSGVITVGDPVSLFPARDPQG